MSNDYAALIVDRSADSRKSLASVLRQGLKITEIYQVSSAKEGMATLKTAKKIDWIFCDTSLPDQNSFTFIEEAKRLPLCEESAFILLSSQTNKEILIKAASTGVNDFIKKPFTSGTLVSKLRKLMTGAEQRTTSRHSLLGIYKADVLINDEPISTSVLDISLGGCLLRYPQTSNDSFGVYSHIEISIPNGKRAINLVGEVVRMERNTDGEEKAINIAFQFISLDEKRREQLSTFIAQIKSPKQTDESLKKTA